MRWWWWAAAGAAAGVAAWAAWWSWEARRHRRWLDGLGAVPGSPHPYPGRW